MSQLVVVVVVVVVAVVSGSGVSQLYVLHDSSSKRKLPWSDVLTKINLR